MSAHDVDDFSTNQSDSTTPIQDPEDAPTTIIPAEHRHPLSFDDGNLALLAEDHYFIVHQGFLCRHSQVLFNLVLSAKDVRKLHGRPVLELNEKWADLGCFLSALYDGVQVNSWCPGRRPLTRFNLTEPT